METFFTSDLHLNHSRVIKYDDRPYDSVEEMNEALIQNYNARVGRRDTVYILGDFAFKKPESFLRRMNGRKILIKGNHDHFSITKGLSIGFDEIHMMNTFKINRMHFTMCHFPMYSWDRSHYGSYHIHGHVHSFNIEFRWNRYNVGVDNNLYEPISFDELVGVFEFQKSLNIGD